MDEVISGLKIGAVLSVIISPTLLVILHYSINTGRKKAFLFCLGLWTSDVLHAIVFTFWINLFPDFLEINKLYFILLSSIILLLIGVKIFMTPVLPLSGIGEAVESKWYRYYFKGFLLSIISPGTAIVWLAITGVSNNKYDSYDSHIIFVLVIIFTVAFFDLLKIFMANLAARLMTISRLNTINKIIGILLIIGSIMIFLRNIVLEMPKNGMGIICQ